MKNLSLLQQRHLQIFFNMKNEIFSITFLLLNRCYIHITIMCTLLTDDPMVCCDCVSFLYMTCHFPGVNRCFFFWVLNFPCICCYLQILQWLCKQPLHIFSTWSNAFLVYQLPSFFPFCVSPLRTPSPAPMGSRFAVGVLLSPGPRIPRASLQCSLTFIFIG